MNRKKIVENTEVTLASIRYLSIRLAAGMASGYILVGLVRK